MRSRRELSAPTTVFFGTLRCTHPVSTKNMQVGEVSTQKPGLMLLIARIIDRVILIVKSISFLRFFKSFIISPAWLRFQVWKLRKLL